MVADLEVQEDDSVAASEESFDVKNMFNKALQIKEGDPGHLQRLYASPSDKSTSWWRGLLNVGMYNIAAEKREIADGGNTRQTRKRYTASYDC